MGLSIVDTQDLFPKIPNFFLDFPFILPSEQMDLMGFIPDLLSQIYYPRFKEALDGVSQPRAQQEGNFHRGNSSWEFPTSNSHSPKAKGTESAAAQALPTDFSRGEKGRKTPGQSSLTSQFLGASAKIFLSQPRQGSLIPTKS